MRLALGCMRLSTDPSVGEERALAVLDRALALGIRTFDTARAYGATDYGYGENELLVARSLSARNVQDARIITKCGMRREGVKWIPDGRAKRIAEDVEASVTALGRAVDLLLLHAPDPRVPLDTTARALERALRGGQARAIGLSNVTRAQAEEIARIVPVSAIEAPLGIADDGAVRRGLLDYCRRNEIPLFAYAPLGGPDRAPKIARDAALAAVAARIGSSFDAVDVLLAYLRALDPNIVPVVGARDVNKVERLVRSASLVLDDDALRVLDDRFPVHASARGVAARSPRAHAPSGAEVVMIMGVQGAGKSRAARAMEADGWARLNRDVLGGTLRSIAQKLDDLLGGGATRVVLDNTYVTRESRSDVVRVAQKYGARVRCIFHEVTAGDAQINVVQRMLEEHGHVLSPEEIGARARRDPTALAPTALFRMLREIEPPRDDEGFAAVERVPFARAPSPSRTTAACFVALDTLLARRGDARWVDDLRARAIPILVYAWRPDATAIDVGHVERAVHDVLGSASCLEVAVCTHPAGPPICWCRPPLPALFVAFAHRHHVALGSSELHGSSSSDRTLARTLGARFVTDARSA